MLDEGAIHALEGMELDGMTLHHTTQNGVQFKTYELFVPGVFYFMFSDLGWPRVTGTMESETVGKEGAATVSGIVQYLTGSFYLA